MPCLSILTELLKTSVNFAVAPIWREVVIALSRNTIWLCVSGYGNITHELLPVDCIDQPVYRTRKLTELRRTRTTPLWLEGIFSLPSWWNWSVASSALREFIQLSDATALPSLLYVDLHHHTQSDFLTIFFMKWYIRSYSSVKFNLKVVL